MLVKALKAKTTQRQLQRIGQFHQHRLDKSLIIRPLLQHYRLIHLQSSASNEKISHKQ